MQRRASNELDEPTRVRGRTGHPRWRTPIDVHTRTASPPEPGVGAYDLILGSAARELYRSPTTIVSTGASRWTAKAARDRHRKITPRPMTRHRRSGLASHGALRVARSGFEVECDMLARELLADTHAYIGPLAALDGLAPALADERPAGAPHSIAEIVAHMTFWLDWFCGQCDGADRPPVEHAADGWPTVTPGSWETVRTRFATGLERALALDRQDASRRLDPPIAFPPLAHYTVRDVIEHIAGHNAHHLGQVVLLRQLLAAWPPPAGSYTW